MSCEGLPYNHEMCLYVGDDFNQKFLWEAEANGTRVPMDLTGGEMWITFSKDYDSPVLTKQADTIADPTLGEFAFSLSPEETRTLMGDAYCTRTLMYDIEFRGNVASPPAYITTLIAGELTCHADVTRAAP